MGFTNGTEYREHITDTGITHLNHICLPYGKPFWVGSVRPRGPKEGRKEKIERGKRRERERPLVRISVLGERARARPRRPQQCEGESAQMRKERERGGDSEGG